MKKKTAFFALAILIMLVNLASCSPHENQSRITDTIEINGSPATLLPSDTDAPTFTQTSIPPTDTMTPLTPTLTQTFTETKLFTPTEPGLIFEWVILGPEGGYEITNRNLYFRFYDDAHGNELWKSDGTEEGTALVKDIYPGENSSAYYGQIVKFGNIVLFQANDGIHGNALWKSDGTEAGTVMVKRIFTGDSQGHMDPLIQWLTVFDDFVLFQAEDIHGIGLWKTDGTPDGTVLVKDYSNATPQSFVRVGPMLFFTVRNSSYKDELWESDGTESGTKMVKNINPGENGSRFSNLMAYKEALFFIYKHENRGDELWKSDGTEAGTVLIKAFVSGTEKYGESECYSINGSLVFIGSGVWRSDGTEAGTVKLSDDQELGSSGFYPLRVGNIVYFNSYNGSTQAELWKTDGTEQGTGMVKDIFPGANGSEPSYFAGVNGKLIFWANDGSGKMESWISDGTVQGTFKLNLPFNLGTRENSVFNGVVPMYYGEVNGKLLFNLYDKKNDDPNEKRIWITDGTEAGTEVLTN